MQAESVIPDFCHVSNATLVELHHVDVIGRHRFAGRLAGTAGSGSGLAFRILEAGYRLNIPRMFAAVVLISFTGILIFAALSLLQHLMLRRWHESAVKRER